MIRIQPGPSNKRTSRNGMSFMRESLRLTISMTVFSLLAPLGRADDWPQWLGPKRDSVWRETGVLDSFPKDGPKVLWRTKISGGFTGPAVADGRVYVMDFVTADNNRLEVYQRKNYKGA